VFHLGWPLDSAPTPLTYFILGIHLSHCPSQYSEIVVDIYDKVIAACPLYIEHNRHCMSVDLNVIKVLVEDEGLNFEEWFTELPL
jgi:hypothetical protein